MTKVTIVCAYNKAIELTKDFIEQMYKTTWHTNIHFILVNGGSETKITHTSDFCIQNSFYFERIDTTETAFCKVLNTGLKAVPEDTDYVFFVGNDSFPLDDKWLPDLIQLQQDTGAWMVCPANDRPGMNAYQHLYRTNHEDYWEVDMFPSIAWLMPYDKFKQIGLLDEQFIRTGMYADNDWCARIRAKGGLIVVSKNILLRHLLSQESGPMGTVAEDMNINNEYYKKKYGHG